MKNIGNWFLGGFFRTIGKFFAFILLFLILMFIFGNSKVKALQLNGYYEGVNFELPQNVNYYFFYNSTMLSDNQNRSYLVGFTEPVYVVFLPHRGSSETYTPIYFKTRRLSISQELYLSWVDYMAHGGTTNPLHMSFGNSSEDGIGYHVPGTNNYYAFFGNVSISNVKRYRIDPVGSGTNQYELVSVGSSIPLRGYIYASNLDLYKQYYSSNSSDTMLNVVFKQAPLNIKQFKVTFHLNGGSMYYMGDNRPLPQPVYTETYSLYFTDKQELEDYIIHSSVKKDLSNFNQWYYDERLTQPYDSENVLDSNINLYVSWEYTSVSSILKNISFQEYTFTNEYQYAVISVQDNFSQGMYLGLGFDFQYLDVYEYVIADSSFTEGSLMTLSSIGAYGDYYYFHLGYLNNTSARVVVLDKANLIKIGINNEPDYYYTFKVSSNCYVDFTNDLTQVSYYLPSGTLLENQDISSNYDYTQKFVLDSNSDYVDQLIKMFNDSDKSLASFFKTLWYKTRPYKLYTYLLTLCLAGIIIAVIKGASRH